MYCITPVYIIVHIIYVTNSTYCLSVNYEVFAVYFTVPVVELVDVLDVSEHDVVLVVET